jgi:DnaJ-class molecular chaperone
MTENVDSCIHCGGSGEIRVPKTYMTCSCCRGREKFRACKNCNGTGINRKTDFDNAVSKVMKQYKGALDNLAKK